MMFKKLIGLAVAAISISAAGGQAGTTAAAPAVNKIEALGVNTRAHLDRPGERGDVGETDENDSHNGVIGTARVAKATVGQYGISYHGGPVMTAGVHTYTIWYGSWPATSTTPAIINGFLSSVGGSPWYAINGGYVDGAKLPVTPSLTLAGSTSDSGYTYGKALTDANIGQIVSSAIASGRLPSDVNGQYLVLTSSDVTATSGFLTRYCGWHTAGRVGTTSIKYSFIGDPSVKLSACAAQTTSSPNNNPAADAMVSIIAHEIAETASDPNLNAWYDSRGAENGDKCAWTFGTTTKQANGSFANVTLAGKSYLVQQNWKNVAPSGVCGMS
jgi:hypothetical protein